MINFIGQIYSRLILIHSRILILLLLLIGSFFAFYGKHFSLDASSDSLLLDDDKDIKVFRELSERYAIADYLFITFTPDQDLFTDHSLQVIADLRNDLNSLELTDSVITLLDLPLFKQVEGSLLEVVGNYRTLTYEGVDKLKAKTELITSPISKELIISLDGKATALQVNLKDNPKLTTTARKRNTLLLKQHEGSLTADEYAQLQDINVQYDTLNAEADRRNHQNILDVRAIMKKYEQFGILHLGGTTMISDDMITFIKNDLLVFGGTVFLFFIIILSIIFRDMCWVVLPLLSCIYAGVLMVGILGFIGWDVTVISSNFISLMLIITMSMNIHLIVRYRQINADMTDLSQQDIVMETVRKMVWPCLYTALTTIIAFSSLLVSGIKPVIEFGWIMTIGLIVIFLTTFLLFPSLLILMRKFQVVQDKSAGFGVMPMLSNFTVNYGNWILLLAGILVVFSIFGISKLKVENSFINYFSQDTEIYRGLKLIDEELGGTATLDIVLKFDEDVAVNDDFDDEDGDFDFGVFDEEITDGYWFTPDKLDQIKAVHDYLEGLPAVGKVLSLASVIRVGEDINQGEFDAFELAIVYKYMPEQLKSTMIDPYISIADNEARISLRILDSQENLRRNELLEQIHTDLTNKLGFSEDQITFSGLMVLYNNMLQSLFRSQILTLAIVMAGIFLMLLVLFRSVSLAIIGIIPNLMASGIILGLMGALNIPLDMMTITIAAITIGIAVDNSIHYIYRFREEFCKFQDYTETIHYCHANIGKAIFYNAITIIVGFSILMLSNFVPTIYFGLLTAFAMSIALLASLTLLPKLLLVWKPLGIQN